MDNAHNTHLHTDCTKYDIMRLVESWDLKAELSLNGLFLLKLEDNHNTTEML